MVSNRDIIKSKDRGV